METYSEFILLKEMVEYYFDSDLEYTSILDEALKIHKKDKFQPWGSIKLTNNNKENEKLLQKHYEEKIIPMVNDAKKEFQRILKKYTPNKGKSIVDVKTLKSLKSKILKRGKLVNTTHDILRGMIIAPDEESVQKTVKAIKRNVKLHEYEYKQFKGDTKFGYYGSHHFGLVMSNGIIAELQVMTRKLSNYKHIAHDIYTKLREPRDPNLNISPEEEKKMLRRSKQIFSMGNNFKKK